MSDQENKANHTDEIDLKELFNSIGNFFKNIFLTILMFFVHLRNATIKHLKIIIICGILGGLVGISLNYLVIDHYSSSLVLKSTHLTGRLMESSVEKLNQLSEEENYGQIAKVLKVDLEVAKQIRGFSYEPFVSEDEIVELEVFKEQLRSQIKDEETINKFVEKLKSENRNTYRITIEVYDNQIIDKLEKPVVDYFRNNEYVQKRLIITRTNLEKEKENIESELRKLDSLKALIFNNFDYLSASKRGSNNVILNEENIANPIDVISEIRSNYKNLLRINEDLYLNEDFELIDGFIAYSKPASPSLLKYGFYSGLIGIGIAYLIIALLAFNRYLNQVEANYKEEK